LKATHLQRGEEVEAAALEFLLVRNFRLIEKNYRSRYGEIDLVMMDRQNLVFIEVRYRSNDRFGGAAQSIDQRKQQKLRRTAERFLQQNHTMTFDGCRFDVIAVSGSPPSYKIDWIADAF
jgi:putative endonuclease